MRRISCHDAPQPRRRRAARVRAPLRAAADRLAGPFVFTALRAAAERDDALRLLAAVFDCRDNARLDAAPCASRLSTPTRARERLAFGSVSPRWPFSYARSALFRVFSDVLPAAGGGSLTPARRALDNPMATACLVERAPCLPLRMCSISSRTNSPTCVVGAFPSRLSLWARSMVLRSGISVS